MDLDRRLGLLDGMYNRANCAHHLSYYVPSGKKFKQLCTSEKRYACLSTKISVIWDFWGGNFKYC